MRKTRLEPLFFWTASAAAAALGLLHFLGGRVYSVQNFAYYADRGELLFHAVLDKGVSYSMPLLSLLVSAAEYHSYLSPEALARGAGLLLALPAYAIGARGGRARGALFSLAAMAAALGVASHEAEQVIYTFALLVFLAAELRRLETGGAPWAAAGGLAAAGTLLIRSPLFTFPPLAAAWGWFSAAGKPGRRLLAAGLFLLCAYLPLAPWVRLNHAVFGRFIPLEEERATCNIITGAAGVTFTIEGDARAYAGISRTASPYPWALQRIKDRPGAYLTAVARRLWQTFLFFPALALLGAAGLWLNRRDPAARYAAFLAGYYVLLHCLLSIEERYFYPVRFLLALLAAGGLWAALERQGFPARDEAARDRLTPALAGLLIAASAVTLGFVFRYPGTARPGLIGVTAALERHPGDPWLHKKLSETLFSYDLTARGRAALADACRLGGRPDLCWLDGALGARPAPPPGVENRYELLLVKALRELELGLAGEARLSFHQAQAVWLEERNGIKALPYRTDLAHLERILATNRTLWDMDLHAALLYWPPAARPGLLDKLSGLTPLTPKLRAVRLAHLPRRSPAEERELAGLRAELGPELQASEFDWPGNTRTLAAELLKTPVPAPAGMPEELCLLAGLGAAPAELAEAYAPHGADPLGAELRAAAEVFLSTGPARIEAAGKLAAAAPGNFAYSLVALREAGFSPAAVKAAMARLKAAPYPLAAGAAAWARRGGRQEALRLAEAALTAGRLDEGGWSLLLLALQEAGDIPFGLRAAEAALREHPRSSQLLNNRGVMRHLAGDAAGAKRDFDAAVLADARNFSAWMNLAAALERAGEAGRAAENYRFVLARSENPADRRNAEAALARLGGAR